MLSKKLLSLLFNNHLNADLFKRKQKAGMSDWSNFGFDFWGLREALKNREGVSHFWVIFLSGGIRLQHTL